MEINVLNDALLYFNKNQGDNDVLAMEVKYPRILPLLTVAYSPTQEYDKDNLHQVINANNFYEKRINLIQDYLNLDYGVKMFEEW